MGVQDAKKIYLRTDKETELIFSKEQVNNMKNRVNGNIIMDTRNKISKSVSAT